ncbi:MAG: bifunctional DNA-formamidopyrimidine glycosylase/DNA-(apurinic or apyrimidinic site) lyase [Acidobacteriota bacterium]
MPELPEVEVVRLSLVPHLPGRRIVCVDVRSPALREPLDRTALEGLAGQRVGTLRRRAKYLLIDVDDGRTLALHLGMSGRLTLVPSHTPPVRHEHVAARLDDGRRLRLVDPRRFGQAFVIATDALERDRHFAHLGPEPLEDLFDGAVLQRAARGRRGPIKTFLMDAGVVVGVGNIYASEALWRAGVHPRRSVARVSAATWERVAGAVRDTLADAIREGGTTLNDFTDSGGHAGDFQVSLAAYGRAGEACDRCPASIRRIVQSNRSTFYCPGCQR